MTGSRMTRRVLVKGLLEVTSTSLLRVTIE